ncbi:hypothetical protein EMCRGX_G019247 [Ephydatia muelleri]
MVLQDVFMEHTDLTDKLKTTVWSELEKSLKDNLISSVEASLTFNKCSFKVTCDKAVRDAIKRGLIEAGDMEGIAKLRASIKGVDIDAENRESAEDSDHGDERITLTKKHLASRLPASAVADVGNARELDIDQNSSLEEE